jgi:hypothetical protein
MKFSKEEEELFETLNLRIFTVYLTMNHEYLKWDDFIERTVKTTHHVLSHLKRKLKKKQDYLLFL